MRGMAERFGEMNRLAESSKGFIWKFEGEVSGEDSKIWQTYLGVSDMHRLFYNMSIWESVEDLKGYAYQTAHVQMLKRKEDWMDHFEKTQLALWWVPAGHRPSVSESFERLMALERDGASAFAFNFKNLHFP